MRAEIHELKQTHLQISKSWRPRPYTIESSVRLHCLRGNESLRYNSVLRDVNIIQIAPTSANAIHTDPAEFICSGFDINLCCVSLRVEENLSYTCTEYYNAAEALNTGRLELRNCAFQQPPYKVSRQMERILKYVQRGFRWNTLQPSFALGKLFIENDYQGLCEQHDLMC